MNRRLLWLAVGLVTGWVVTVRAAEEAPPRLTKIEVPAEYPEKWPAYWRELNAVPRAEFERVWTALQRQGQQQPVVSLEHVTYSATLDGHSLVDGQGHLALSPTSQPTRWLTFSPWNMAISSMHWAKSTEPALWGVSSDGQFWLAADDSARELDFTWSHRGTAVGQRTVFDLQLPMAQASHLRLRVPAHITLSSPQVPVRQVLATESTASGWNEWEVLLGSDSRVSLIAEPLANVAPQPMVCYRRQMMAALREDHMRFEATFQLEVLNGEIRELELTTPAAAHVYAITWGNNLPLEWSRVSTSGPRDSLRIRFPDPQAGVLRSIRLEGIVSQRPGAAISLPQIELPNGVFRSGEIQVSVARPLMLSTQRMTGCRPLAPMLASSEGETHQFLQTTSLVQLIVEVRRPRSLIHAQVFSTLKLSADEWAWNNELLWTSTSGTAFQLAVKVPEGWNVTEASTLSATGEIQPIHWDATTETDGSQRLALELLEGVTPDRPRRIFIATRRTVQSGQSQFACPVLEPLDCQSVATLVCVDGGENYAIFPTAPGNWTEWTRAELPETWQQMISTPVLDAALETSRWYEIPQGRSDLALTLYSQPEPVTADIHIQAEAKEGLLTETIRLRVKPASVSHLTRLLVAFSELSTDVAWTVREPDHLSLISSRIPVSHSPSRDTLPAGELWELQLPDTDAPELTIEGVRTRPLSLPSAVGLAYLPQARVYSATVSVSTSETSGLQPLTRGMIEIHSGATKTVSSPATAMNTQTWGYDSHDAQLMLVSRRSSLQEAPCLAHLHLQSTLSALQSGADFHRLVISLSAHAKSLRILLPKQADIESIMLDGQVLTVADDQTIVIPPQVTPAHSELRIQFRLRQTPGFLRDLRQVPLPICEDVVWTECQWDFSLPPAAMLVREPKGLRLTTAVREPSWFDRIFGPMGRSTSPLFQPWNPSTWVTLSGRNPTALNADPVQFDEFQVPAQWQKLTAYTPAPAPIWVVESWHRGRMRILAWLAMVLTSIVVISIRQAGLTVRTRFACVWFAVWIGIAVAIMPPWEEPVGGVIAGSIIAWLLPRRWLCWQAPKAIEEPVVPVGSTQSFLLPKQVVTSGLVLASLGLTSWAEPRLPVTAGIEEIVLAPVDSDGTPARKLSLVYLHPRTWSQLRERAARLKPSSPDLLLQSVWITAKPGSGSRVPVKLEADVLAFGSDPVCVLDLPSAMFASSTSQLCRVDGAPASLTPQPSRIGQQVTWPRPSTPVSALGSPVPSRHRLTLEWQQPWQPAGPRNTMDLSLIPAAITTAELVMGESTLPMTVPTVDHKVSTVVIGHAQPKLQLDWPADARAIAATEIHVDVVEACELTGDVLETRSRLTARPRSGALSAFSIQLPLHAVVRRWNCNQTADCRFVAAPDGRLTAETQLELLTEADVVMELEYVTPIKPFQSELAWSGLEVLGTPSLRVSDLQRWFSLYAPIDYQVQPLMPETTGLILSNYNQVADRFRGLVQDRIPQLTYQILQRNPLTLQLLPNTAKRKLLQWQQTGTIQGDRLKWEIEGEIEASGVPVYTHQLLVDRRLTIDSISIRERGTERLAARSGIRSSGNSGSNRITLYLTDPVSEVQKITISASMPISSDNSLSLPNVRCEDAELVQGRVTLRTNDAFDIHWLSARGLRERPVDSQSSPATDDQRHEWQFQQLDLDWRATVKVSTPVSRTQARAVHVISSDDPQSLQCQSLWRIPAERLRGASAILVPAPWEIASDSAIIGGSFQVTRSPQGEWSVGLEADPTASDVFVKLRLRIQRGALKSDHIPLPRPLGDIAEDLEIWTAEHTRLPQSPLLKISSTETATGPEDWSRGVWQMPVPQETDRYRWLATPTETVELLPAIDATAASLQVPWVEHLLWRGTTKAVRGMTQIRLASPQLTLTVQMPHEIRFQAAVIDDQPAETRVETEGEVQMSSKDGRPFRSVRLIWDQAFAESASPLGVWECQWPHLAHAQVQQLAVCVIPESTTQVRGRGDWTAGDWIDRLLLRLEVQGDTLATAQNSPDFQPEVEEFREQYAEAATELGDEHQQFDQASPQRHSRWKSIVEAVNSLQPVSNGSGIQRENYFEPRYPMMLVAKRDLSYGMVQPADQNCRWWLFDRHWLYGLRGLLLTMITWPLLILASGPVRSPWWQAHPYVTTAVLGLVWWICLIPSLFGFALLAFGLYRIAFPPASDQGGSSASTSSAPAVAS
ncbi:hypothetical protein GC163_04725 [bacterium]|nr:hypothetical protein [bacterium]